MSPSPQSDPITCAERTNGSRRIVPDQADLRECTDTVQTVECAFELLELISDAGREVTLTELAAAVRRPPSSIHRLLQTCKVGGYVRQLSSHRYVLGPRLIPLAESAGLRLAQLAQPRLRELVAELGETATMGRHEGDHVTYMAQHASLHAMRLVTEVGQREHLHATAIGKAILATLAEAEVREIVKRTGMPPQTPNTITALDALLEDLACIRSRGYAIDDEEQELGVRAFAVLVSRSARLGISISGPVVRVDHAFAAAAVKRLKWAAAEIADDL